MPCLPGATPKPSSALLRLGGGIAHRWQCWFCSEGPSSPLASVSRWFAVSVIACPPLFYLVLLSSCMSGFPSFCVVEKAHQSLAQGPLIQHSFVLIISSKTLFPLVGDVSFGGYSSAECAMSGRVVHSDVCFLRGKILPFLKTHPENGIQNIDFPRILLGEVNWVRKRPAHKREECCYWVCLVSHSKTFSVSFPVSFQGCLCIWSTSERASYRCYSHFPDHGGAQHSTAG